MAHDVAQRLARHGDQVAQCGRGQALVLCTDAMLEQCRPADLREILCDARASAQEAAERMLLLALRGDADENLSALILRRA